MTGTDPMPAAGASGQDALAELHFALAEADAQTPAPTLFARVRAVALSTRRAGRPSEEVETLSGLETFRRAAAAFGSLLEGLETVAWSTEALRGLDVQGLVGHLIGVEVAFVASLRGDREAAVADHVASTDGSARAQAGRDPATTLAEWRSSVDEAVRTAEALDQHGEITFYGITLPLDDLLVVRAFELWIHEEDIRRALGRALDRPDEGRLARMTALAMVLLPGRAAPAAPGGSRERTRLVLTGPGGGTWDLPVGGDAGDRARPATRVVVDAADFCRVVGNRLDLDGTAAVVDGDRRIAAELFAAAAALALD